MKTVLYINATGEISGAERSLLAMLAALDRDRWSPLVVAPEGPLLREVARLGISPITAALQPMTRPRTLRQAWQVWRQLRFSRHTLKLILQETKPDIIHANTTSAMLALPSRLSAPVIWQLRDLTPLGRIGRWLYHRATRVAAISFAVRDDLMPYADDGGQKITILPPAVDVAHFHPADDRHALRAMLGLPSDGPLIGLVAQFVPWKRHHLFLDALELIADQPWQAVLAGADLHRDDKYCGSIHDRISRPPLAGRVHWLPWQGDAQPLMAALDICALTSQREPFGRVLIEAMACGTPVVAVDEGGVRDIVLPERTGLLAPADALAVALRRLLDDAPLRDALGRQGRTRVIEQFSLERQRAQLTQLYASLC